MQVSPGRRLKEQSTATFTCQATANPLSVLWRWYRDGVLVDGQTSNTFVFTHIPRSMHSKVSECEAINKVNATRKGTTLNIEYSPRIAEPAQHKAVDLLDDVPLKCTVDGNPAPVVVWRKRGSETILSSTPELHLRHVTTDDLGPYLCTASSAGFPDAQQDIYLFKKDKPTVRSETMQSARYGDKGVIVCNVESIPKPTSIRWTRNDEVIDLSATDRYRVHTEETLRGQKSILEILNVKDTDFGEFNCTVANALGAHSQAITLVHKDVLPLPYIIIGIPVGGCVAIFISVLVFICIRRVNKRKGSQTGSDEAFVNKGEHTPYPFTSLPRRDVIYHSSTADFPRPIDSGLPPRYHTNRMSRDYDELLYPRMGFRGHMPAPGALYGAYAGPALRQSLQALNNFAPPMHYSEYGTYRPDYLASHGYQPASSISLPPRVTTPLPRPQSPASTNPLSTNV